MLWGALGVYGTQPTGHLALAARLERYSVADLTDALARRRSAVRLRTLRGSGFLIPTELLPITQAATRERNVRSFLPYVQRNLKTATYEGWAERILELLSDGPLAAGDIRSSLEAGEDAGMIRYVVSVMAAENRIVRAASHGSWRSDRAAYARWEDWLPGVDVWGMEPAEARARLAGLYLDAYGPASVEDLAWWSGMTKRETRRALEAAARPVEIGGIAMWATREVRDDPPRGVRLLPAWDPLLVGYRNRDRLLAPTHQGHVYDRMGNATSVVLSEGSVVGVWDLGKDDVQLEVKAAPIDELSGRVWDGIAVEAERIGRLIGSESVRLVRCDRAPWLADAPQNRFLFPLS